jgi:Diadenosine tetraphosphate (Ap4A) hydrolase and other HIT family hydrolases
MCIFCKIIAGEIPSYKIYEDDNAFAFLDIKPVNPGHVLVIPKKHYQNMEEIPDSDLQALILVVKKIGAALKNKLGVIGYNIHENNDLIAGQAVPHLHFHIIPRIETDCLSHWPGSPYLPGQAEDIIKKLSF